MHNYPIEAEVIDLSRSSFSGPSPTPPGSEIQASFHFSCLSKGKVAAVSNLSVGAGLNQANAAKKDRATSRTQAKRGYI